MSISRANSSQLVPACAAGALPRSAHRASPAWLPVLAVLAALACDGDSGNAPRIAPPERQEAPAPRPQAPPLPISLDPELPRCPAIGCDPESFEVLFERAEPWPAGTYYIRASVDGGPRRVCSVVFEPVLGAAHDTCSSDFPFRVHYRYDELEQAISAVSFGQVHAVQLTVLTSEEEPPLVQVEHQLTHRYSSGVSACGPCPSGPEPLSVRVAEPQQLADAGSGDAGQPGADAGVSQRDAGAGDSGAP